MVVMARVSRPGLGIWIGHGVEKNIGGNAGSDRDTTTVAHYNDATLALV